MVPRVARRLTEDELKQIAGRVADAAATELRDQLQRYGVIRLQKLQVAAEAPGGPRRGEAWRREYNVGELTLAFIVVGAYIEQDPRIYVRLMQGRQTVVIWFFGHAVFGVHSGKIRCYRANTPGFEPVRFFKFSDPLIPPELTAPTWESASALTTDIAEFTTRVLAGLPGRR